MSVSLLTRVSENGGGTRCPRDSYPEVRPFPDGSTVSFFVRTIYRPIYLTIYRPKLYSKRSGDRIRIELTPVHPSHRGHWHDPLPTQLRFEASKGTELESSGPTGP